MGMATEWRERLYRVNDQAHYARHDQVHGGVRGVLCYRTGRAIQRRGGTVWAQPLLERMDDLTEYASELLKRLRLAMEAEPRYSADARVVSLADLCGAIQLIQAGEADFRDVERLDWLGRE